MVKPRVSVERNCQRVWIQGCSSQECISLEFMPKDDGIKREGLWEPSWMGLVPYKWGSRDIPSPFLQVRMQRRYQLWYHWRIYAFELWCWGRLLRVPWTARRSNQLILRKYSPEYSLEGLMLKLKFQYFGHLMRRVDLLKKPLMLGKIEGKRRGGKQRMRWSDNITISFEHSRRQWRTQQPGVLHHRVEKSQTQLSNRTARIFLSYQTRSSTGQIQKHNQKPLLLELFSD